MRWFAATALVVFLHCSFAEDQPAAAVLVQVCFVTGFEHHDGKRVFSRLQVGDALFLVREAGNAEDSNAVRVDWRQYTLGYVPRDANVVIARQLDFGNRLRARVIRLSRHRDPNRRVEMEIVLPL